MSRIWAYGQKVASWRDSWVPQAPGRPAAGAAGERSENGCREGVRKGVPKRSENGCREGVRKGVPKRVRKRVRKGVEKCSENGSEKGSEKCPDSGARARGKSGHFFSQNPGAQEKCYFSLFLETGRSDPKKDVFLVFVFFTAPPGFSRKRAKTEETGHKWGQKSAPKSPKSQISPARTFFQSRKSAKCVFHEPASKTMEF